MAAGRSADRIRVLREQALKLVGSGKHAQAVELYAQLAELEPLEGDHARRAADCCLHLKKPELRAQYSLAAANAYLEARSVLKAIAMCKVVLSIEPHNAKALEILGTLGSGATHAVRPPAAPPAAPPRLLAEPAAQRLARIIPKRIPAGTPVEGKVDGAPPERREIPKRRLTEAMAALRLARAERTRQDPRPTFEVPPPKVHAAATIEPRVDLPPPSESQVDSAPRLPLHELVLSQRVPAVNVPSLPPAPGNVYSLTLGGVPSALFVMPRLPNVVIRNSPSMPPSTLEPGSDGGGAASVAPPSLRLPGDRDRSELAAQDFGDVPLLGDLPSDILRQLITDVGLLELEPGSVLFEEGDEADAMYLILEGAVTAVTLPRGARPIELAHLYEGDFFGEVALMSTEPRRATVTAQEFCRLLRFDRDIVAVLVHQEPEFLATLLRFLRKRVADDLLATSPVFASLDAAARATVAEQFEFLEIEPGAILLQRGQPSIGMYVLVAGEAILRGASEAGTVRKLTSGDIFGEQALLENRVSTIDVTARSRCLALCLPSDALPDVLQGHPTVRDYLSTLREGTKGELAVGDDFLDHLPFF